MRGIFTFSREKISLVFKAPALYFMTLLPDMIFRRWISRYDGVVLIYQMGKVASSTIYATLKKDPRLLVLHFHRMPGQNRVTINKRLGLLFRFRAILHDLQGTIGHRLMKRWPNNVFLISLVRDPFSRNISGFFQNLWMQKIGSDSISREEKIKEVVNLIATNYDHEMPLRWFDDEFFPSTGIDVFEVPFEASAKAGLSRTTKCPLLIFRTDLADEVKINLLREYLGRPHLELAHSNTSETKFYADLYREVKEEFVYPADYVDQALNSKLMRHFFTSDEISELRKKYGGSDQMSKDES